MDHARPDPTTSTPDANRVIVVGDGDRDEFSAWMDWWSSTTGVMRFRRLAELLAQTTSLAPPQLIVLAQSRPGEFARDELQQLLRQWPLARIVDVYGNWCESETRTGLPPQSVVRISWSHARARLALEWERLQRGARPAWSRPWTMTSDESLLEERNVVSHLSDVRVAVCSASRDIIESLEELIRSWGNSVVSIAHGAGESIAAPDVILWDDTAGPRGPQRSWRPLRDVYPKVPLIALVSFPREGELRLLEGAGPAMLLAKPFEAEVLRGCVHQLIGPGCSWRQRPSAA